MAYPEKWRETCDPFALAYHEFRPTEVLGYPHAGNDVFRMRGEWEGRADVFRALRVLRSVAAGAYGRRVTPGNARWNGLVHAESENNMPTARAFARLPFGYCGRAGMSFAN